MPPSWTIAIGCDDAGSEYKELIKADMEKDPRVKAVIDCGVTKGSDDFKTPYPHTGVATARKVASGEADRALLICGTGMGVAIAANKVKGIRVSYFARRQRKGAELTRPGISSARLVLRRAARQVKQRAGALPRPKSHWD
jgi:RpiB/LacA/LacB family sugar-phosphate isomerase